MKKLIQSVTVTGANDRTSFGDMMMLQQQYPFVEWGILLSKSQEGSNRFPSREWMEKGMSMFADKLNLSGHLCGKWVRDLCSDGYMADEVEVLLPAFKRVQLNFHAIQHTVTDLFIERLCGYPLHQFIFQFDEVNNRLMDACQGQGIDAVPLFDTSGGAGVLPGEWPEAFGKLCGYAGGLSPDNLMEEMSRIEAKCGQGPIWIDAETLLRSDQDKHFDLHKVAAFLEAAKPWILDMPTESTERTP